MKTKVIFRKVKQEGEIIAVFPADAGDSNPYRTCSFYEHDGQHGAMSIDFMSATIPAKPNEYESLKAELESIGYDLRIVKRFNHKDLQERINQTKRYFE